MLNLFISVYGQRINNYLLVILAFFLSISIYITDVIIFLLFISWLLSGDLKNKIQTILKNPITYSVSLFIIYFMSSYLWSDSSLWNNTTQKQLLLLLFPVLCTCQFDKKYIEIAKYSFIIGLLINILLSLITFFVPSNSLFKTGHYDYTIFAHGFLDHFDYSIFLCFGIFLILSSLINKKIKSKYLILIIVLLLALLNSYGRIGIISFFLFTPIIILFFLKKTITKYAYLTALLSFSLICYYVFSPVNTRFNESLYNIKILYYGMSDDEKIDKDAAYLASNNDSLSKEYFISEIYKNPEWIEIIQSKAPQYETSIGKRYLYLINSIALIKDKPLIGAGANQFAKLYTHRYPHLESIKHPHNNFIFILSELGTLGLCIMLFIFYNQIKTFWNQKNTDFLQLIFPLFFLFIMFFDNYFINHNTLVFYCLFSFLIYHPTFLTKYKPA